MVHLDRVGDPIGARTYLDQIDKVGYATKPSDIAISRRSLELIDDLILKRHDAILDFHLDLLVGDFEVPVEDFQRAICNFLIGMPMRSG